MTTEKRDAVAAEWAEHDLTVTPRSGGARRGSVAAEFGREVTGRATGGRPPLDPAAKPGEHAHIRQVRLPAVMDRQLQALAQQQARTTSALLRDAVADYLVAHADEDPKPSRRPRSAARRT
jgi:hypothetical protein